MIGLIQVIILVIVVLSLAWAVFLLIYLNLADRRMCACGHFSVGGSIESFTQYSYDDHPIYVHERNRCYPYLEEIV